MSKNLKNCTQNSPLDFWMWRELKTYLLLHRSTSISQLRQSIVEYFNILSTTPEQLVKAVEGMERRLDACLQSGGTTTDNKAQRERLLREMAENERENENAEENAEENAPDNGNFAVDLIGGARYEFEFGHVDI